MMTTRQPIGVLLLNLGTPMAPNKRAVKRYLRQFLSDPRVIDLPSLLRWLLLRIFILPFRPKKSAKAYQQIWTEQGSPLLVHSQELRAAIEKQLGDHYVVAVGMRYGEPSIAEGLGKLLTAKCRKIIILPLFPQYSSAATGSALAESLNILKQQWHIPPLEIISNFHDHPLFIQSLTSVISEHLTSCFKPEILLFSYHGIPERQLKNDNCKDADCKKKSPCPIENIHSRYCYRSQCYTTTRLIVKELFLSPKDYRIGFQSRLGRTPWITPYTDQLLSELAEQGVKKLAIICPSFVADCLETLEEIGIRAKRQWQQLGGTDFTLIPCLNAHPQWVNALTTIIRDRGQA